MGRTVIVSKLNFALTPHAEPKVRRYRRSASDQMGTNTTKDDTGFVYVCEVKT